MALYETTFITRQDVPMLEVKKLTDAFAKILSDLGGKVSKVEQWGLREFAYPISKTNKGYYTLLASDSPFEAIQEMERKMGLNESILRHVTFSVEKITNTPSPVMENDDSASEKTLDIMSESVGGSGDE